MRNGRGVGGGVVAGGMSQAAGPEDDNNLWILWEDLQAKRSFFTLCENLLKAGEWRSSLSSD